MKKSVFYHAGCPVCVSAEHEILELVGTDNVEIVHFGTSKSRIPEAEKAENRGLRQLHGPLRRQDHLPVLRKIGVLFLVYS